MSLPSLLACEPRDDVLLVRLIGKILLDPVSVGVLGDELQAIIQKQKPAKLVVSFSDVDRCSTDVINALLVAKKRLLSEGGELRLCEMSENIRYTYRILNLDGTVFRIYETADEAVDAFQLDSSG